MSKLAWQQREPEGSLEAFLARNPPSKTYMPKDGDGWIWVRSNREREVVGGGSSESLKEAKEALDGLVNRYQEIEDNPKIPRVKSKTSGPSKKTMRENAAKQTEQKLRSVGKNWPCGKWLFYERAAYVDMVFSKLAKSIIDGPLSNLPNAKCHTIKVSTADSLEESSSSNRRKDPTSVICLYFDVVWNADHAKEVLECVVKEHGELPNSAKADLYTSVGLDSNHPSKLRSTLYRPAEIFNDELLKEWQADFRVRTKRKSEGEKDSSGKSDGKRRLIESTNGHVVPVRPEDYWSTTKEDDEGFEESPKEEKAPASDTKVEKTTTKAPATKREAESDSETEDEEEIIMVTEPKKRATTSSSPSKDNKLDRNSTSPQAKQEVAERKPTPIKRTILPTTSVTKKRDRFGRSDF